MTDGVEVLDGPPPAAAPARSKAAERQKRWRERRRAERAAQSVRPPDAESSTAGGAHRVTFGGGVDFSRFVQDGPVVEDVEASAEPTVKLGADPFATVEAPRKVTPEEAAPYGVAVAAYVGLGLSALLERLGPRLGEQERALAVEARPHVLAFIHGATVRLCCKYGVGSFGYLDELAVASALGVSTWALVGGGGGGLGGLMRGLAGGGAPAPAADQGDDGDQGERRAVAPDPDHDNLIASLRAQGLGV